MLAMAECTVASRIGSPPVWSRAATRTWQRFVGPVDVQDVAEGQEGVRPARAARDLVEDDAEPHLRPVRVAGGEGCLGRLDEIGGPDVGRRGHAGSLVEQVGGDARRAASEGDPSRVPERLGDRCVAALDRRRQVDGALDGVVDHLGEGGVEGTAFAWRCIGDGDRGVQGMRRPEARAVGDEDALFAGRVDRPVAPGSQDALHEAEGRVGRHGHDEEAAARLAVQGGQAVAHERPDLSRHRERLARRQLDRSRLQRAADLEGQERVARAGFMEANEQRPRMRHPEPLVDQATQGADRQRADREQHTTIDRVGQRCLARWGGLRPDLRRACPSSEDEADLLRSEAPSGEGEGVFAGAVGPLHVVDGHEQRAIGGQDPETGLRRPCRPGSAPALCDSGMTRPRAVCSARRRGSASGNSASSIDGRSSSPPSVAKARSRSTMLARQMRTRSPRDAAWSST